EIRMQQLDRLTRVFVGDDAIDSFASSKSGMFQKRAETVIRRAKRVYSYNLLSATDVNHSFEQGASGVGDVLTEQIGDPRHPVFQHEQNGERNQFSGAAGHEN